MRRPKTLAELQSLADDYAAVEPTLNVRMYRPELCEGRSCLVNERLSPLTGVLMFDLPDRAAIVPPEMEHRWNVPIEQLFADAIERSVREAKPIREDIEVAPSSSLTLLSSPSIYFASLLLRPELLATDRGAGLLLAAPSANRVLIHELEPSTPLHPSVLSALLAIARGIHDDESEQLRLSPKAWWVHGDRIEYIGAADEGPAPIPIMSNELAAALFGGPASKPWWRFW